MGLLSAVRRFESERDASFRTFAEHCIRNRLYTAVRTAARSKHGPLNDSVPFDAAAVGERLEQRDPEELILSRERVSEIEGAARSMLSGLEAEVLELYLQGCSYQEIAEQTGRAPKSVDNAVQRLRKKLSAYLSRR